MFPGQTGGFFLHLAANPPAACSVIHSEITDSGEVTLERNLWDEMQGEKTHGLGWVPRFFPYEQHLRRIAEHGCEADLQKILCAGVFQLRQQPVDAGRVA